MELKSFIKHFKLITEESVNDNLVIYLFGSFTSSLIYTDIDILIIYSNYDELQKIKCLILEKFKTSLIHFTCLTKTEEEELNFVEKVNAIKIFK